MLQSDRGSGHSRSYVFTMDLASKVGSLAQFGIVVPDINDPVFKEVDDELIRLISNIMPDCRVVSINMVSLAQQMVADAAELDKSSKMAKSTIVSTCSEVAHATRGATIEVNRIISPDGQSLPIGCCSKMLGPRPGFPSIENQVAGIAARKTPIVLVEDGSFSGGTIKFLVEKFTAAKVKIDAIFIGVAFPKAVETIKSVFSGELIVASGDQYDPHNLVDWMPDHDFVPFVPNCGKVVGHEFLGELSPAYRADGFSMATPYLCPYLKTSTFADWTSLPKSEAVKFSRACIDLSKNLFDHLGNLNGRQLQVADLQKGYRHVSIPYVLGQKLPMVREETIHESLMSAYNMLNGY